MVNINTLGRLLAEQLQNHAHASHAVIGHLKNQANAGPASIDARLQKILPALGAYGRGTSTLSQLLGASAKNLPALTGVTPTAIAPLISGHTAASDALGQAFDSHGIAPVLSGPANPPDLMSQIDEMLSPRNRMAQLTGLPYTAKPTPPTSHGHELLDALQGHADTSHGLASLLESLGSAGGGPSLLAKLAPALNGFASTSDTLGGMIGSLAGGAGPTAAAAAPPVPNNGVGGVMGSTLAGNTGRLQPPQAGGPLPGTPTPAPSSPTASVLGNVMGANPSGGLKPAQPGGPLPGSAPPLPPSPMNPMLGNGMSSNSGGGLRPAQAGGPLPGSAPPLPSTPLSSMLGGAMGGFSKSLNDTNTAVKAAGGQIAPTGAGDGFATTPPRTSTTGPTPGRQRTPF